jgi:hypothetical protein
VKHMFKWGGEGGGAVNKVGDVRQKKFWHDVWLDDVPIRISYQELF